MNRKLELWIAGTVWKGKRFIVAEDVWLEAVVEISTKRRRSRNGKSK